MISMTVAFGPAHGGAWHFLFKSKASADAARKVLATDVGTVEFQDDYGQSASIRIDQIHGILTDDLSQSAEAQIQRGLHQARTQAKAQLRGQSDPELKGIATLAGGAPRMQMSG